MLKRALLFGGLGGVATSLVMIFPLQIIGMGRVALPSIIWFVICVIATIAGLTIKE